MSSITSHSDSVSAPTLLAQVRGRIRFKHYSIRTEQAYVDWIKRFIGILASSIRKTWGAAELSHFDTSGSGRARRSFHSEPS